ncbi:hypothetical protein EYF80_016516 [Liparis tanakae]|uniref:Uncharacterized protein n=1 Tax=Liparis tanakae TaxID=230148 RepID=A0A4Z2I8C6_9TELE|nr:hypothetical protein EYF80_016516 [Liparis tanakae]
MNELLQKRHTESVVGLSGALTSGHKCFWSAERASLTSLTAALYKGKPNCNILWLWSPELLY